MDARSLLPCDDCGRHLRSTEKRCPFCARRDANPRPLALLGALALGACHSSAPAQGPPVHPEVDARAQGAAVPAPAPSPQELERLRVEAAEAARLAAADARSAHPIPVPVYGLPPGGRPRRTTRPADDPLGGL